jgi:hypothetical protein
MKVSTNGDWDVKRGQWREVKALLSNKKSSGMAN